MFDFRFEDDYIRECYNRRQNFYKLRELTEADSKFIKERMRENGMFYSSTKNFNLNINFIYKASEKFINLLEENNLCHLITKTVNHKNFEKGLQILSLDDKDNYKEFYYEVLYINKK